MSRYDYLRDPDAIYRLSFELSRREVDLSHLPPGIDELALRLIHACAMPEILPDLVWTPDLPLAVRKALQNRRPILSDVAMVAYGVIRSRLPQNNCLLSFLYKLGRASCRETSCHSASHPQVTAPHKK